MKLDLTPIRENENNPSNSSSLNLTPIEEPAQAMPGDASSNQISMKTVEELRDPDLINHPIKATVKGIGRGVGDAAIDMGDLAADILNNFEISKGAGDVLKSGVNKGKEFNQASALEIANPISSSLGAGLGYTLGSIIFPAGAIKGAIQGAKRIPYIGEGIKTIAGALHPAIRGAGVEGAIGSTQGAMMSPEDRGWGATIGGTLGGVTGALGGALSKGIQGYNQNMGSAIQGIEDLGIDVNSPAGMARIRQELTTRGAGDLKSDIQQGITNKVQAVVDDIRPDSVFVPDKAPNQIIRDKIATNFKDVESTKNSNYQPLTESTGTIEAKSVNDSTQILSKKGKQFLPTELPENATFAQLQDYRQALDGSIKSAKASMKSGNLSNKDLNNLYNVRKEVSAKMAQSAESQGLMDQFTKAEAYYKNSYLPFRTFSSSGKIHTPEEIDQTWNKINTLMNSKNPNPKELRDLVSTLGDEGKQIVGWSLVQNALSAAKRGDEIALPKFNNEINKYRVSGLGDIIAAPDYKKAVMGINRIVAEGREALKIKTNKFNFFGISQALNSLMETESGIKLIIKLGGADKKSKAYREAIQRLFTGLSNTAIQQPGQRFEQPASGRNPGE